MSNDSRDTTVMLLMCFILFLALVVARMEGERRNLMGGKHLELVKGNRYAVWVDSNEVAR